MIQKSNFLSFIRNKIERNSNLKHIVQNTGWLSFEKIFRMGLGIIVSIFVARYLGPAKFGILSYANSLVAFLGSFVYLGLNGLVIRELVREPDDKNIILGTTFALKLLSGLLGFFSLLILVMMTQSSSTERWVIIIIGCTFLFRPFEVIDFWFYSLTRAKFSVISKSIAFLGASATKLLIVFLSGSLIAIAFTGLIELVLSVCIIIFILHNSKQSILSWEISVSKAIELLRQSWVLILSGFLSMVYLKIDQIMLRWIIGSEEVGQYSIAVMFSESWYFIPAAIAMSVYPKLIEEKKNELQYQRSLQKIMDVLFLIAFSISIIFTVIGPRLITLLYGESYSKAGWILMIHIWAGIFIFMRSLFSKWVLIENMLFFSLVTHGFGAITNILLNFVLIKLYAGYGAAIATLASYAVASYFSLFFHHRTRSVANMMTKSFLFPFRMFFFKESLSLK